MAFLAALRAWRRYLPHRPTIPAWLCVKTRGNQRSFAAFFLIANWHAPGGVMVLFRGAFWIAMVVVLVPPVPDPVMSKNHSSGAALLAAVQTSVLTKLARVKADLKTSRSPPAADTYHR